MWVCCVFFVCTLQARIIDTWGGRDRRQKTQKKDEEQDSRELQRMERKKWDL